MDNFGDMKRSLSRLIDNKRMEHSIGVSETAVQLAKCYGSDTRKAEIAGLIHDCAKCLSYDEMIEFSDKYGLLLDDIQKLNPALIHAPLGAYMAQDVFGINDEEIINGIRYHTTGRKNMTLFEKIICLADYIEPSRAYPGVEKLRSIAFEGINRALIIGMSMSMKNIIDKGILMHPKTVEARNFLLIEFKNSNC